MSTRRLAIVLALATCAVLIAMAIVAQVTGATQERLEHVLAPAVYHDALLAHAGGLRLLMALDIAFLVLYTAFFAALALHLQRTAPAARLFAWLALGAMLATALLDIVEDHHILAMLETAEHGLVPEASSIAWQSAESATKFSISFLSLVLFGLAIPRTTKLGIVLALFLTVGTLASAVVGYAVPPAQQAGVEAGRWLGFLAGFALAIAWLVREPEPS